MTEYLPGRLEGRDALDDGILHGWGVACDWSHRDRELAYLGIKLPSPTDLRSYRSSTRL